PDFVELSKSVSQNNPCFNRMFGIIPISGLNDLLNIIPNLFIIGGILGTFLGVMNALPELGGMDLANAENSKVIMETFLIKISFSMSTSIAGIVLSVIMTIVNTFFSAYKISVNTVDSLNESMGTLWAISHHNLQDGSEPAFDSSKDPLLVLAEDSIVAELNVQPGFIKLTRPIQGWWLKKSEKEDENDQAEGSKTQEKQPEQEEVKEVDRRTTGYTGGGLDITDPTINAEKTTSADANISKEEEKEIEKKDPTEDPAADNVA
ncbi:hypothetical protein HON22_04545, partial [Candidatus Peregrinibacteria bacterium]|nr:hypothetical protein [Candidatus Peregrinibacteria bacterium]